MGERLSYELGHGFAEIISNVFESEYRRGERDLDASLRRLKDLSAYSPIHAEIMEQREGVELLALAMFFGTIDDRQFQNNQARLQLLSE